MQCQMQISEYIPDIEHIAISEIVKLLVCVIVYFIVCIALSAYHIFSVIIFPWLLLHMFIIVGLISLSAKCKLRCLETGFYRMHTVYWLHFMFLYKSHTVHCFFFITQKSIRCLHSVIFIRIILKFASYISIQFLTDHSELV